PMSTTQIHTLSLHDALPIYRDGEPVPLHDRVGLLVEVVSSIIEGNAHASRRQFLCKQASQSFSQGQHVVIAPSQNSQPLLQDLRDRKSTRLNSSHQIISYAV